MVLVKDLLTDELFIQLTDEQSNQQGSNYSLFTPYYWSYYQSEGILNVLVQELKELNVEIAPVWNKWSLKDDVWELEITHRDESDSYCEYAFLCLYGEPCLQPTKEQKAEAESLFLKAQEEWAIQTAQYQAERQEKEQALSQALESILGGKVVEFVPPGEFDEEEYHNERGHLIVKNTEGQLVKFTSCHWMVGYEDATDSLRISIV
jgi:hypothetical protein